MSSSAFSFTKKDARSIGMLPSLLTKQTGRFISPDAIGVVTLALSSTINKTTAGRNVSV